MRPGQLSTNETQILDLAEKRYSRRLAETGVSCHVKRDFGTYAAIREAHGERHLNQAFDARCVRFGAGDFWLLAENQQSEPIATFCVRRMIVDDFYEVIRSLTLWFGATPSPGDARFIVECRIPSFGGEVVHSGGLWIRDDYRGFARLAEAMPRLARVVAMRERPFDHDTAMIRNHPGERAEVAQRKAVYMGRKVYGFARVESFVNGWFPPEGRDAIMHLCHATRAEAIASLFDPPRAARGRLPGAQFRQPSFIDQHDQPIHPPAIAR